MPFLASTGCLFVDHLWSYLLVKGGVGFFRHLCSKLTREMALAEKNDGKENKVRGKSSSKQDARNPLLGSSSTHVAG